MYIIVNINIMKSQTVRRCLRESENVPFDEIVLFFC